MAKETVTLDRLSDGRVTLGLGGGAREDDFLATLASFHERGKRFEKQLEEMTRAWSGEWFSYEVEPIGPAPVQPAGPEILIGQSTQIVAPGVAGWGNGFI